MRSVGCATAWVWGEATAMTHPHGPRSHEPQNPGSDLIDLAVPYALHALPDAERDEVETRLAHAGLATVDAFYDEVRAVRETMAVVSTATAAEPPDSLRERLLTAVADDNVRTLPDRRASRRRTAWLSAAAAAVIGLGALGVGLSLRPPEPQQTTAQQVFSAPDVHTVSGAIPAGGTATVVFSRDRNAGVLVMNDVPPPHQGRCTKCGWSATRARRRPGRWTPPRWHLRLRRCCRISATRPSWRSPSNQAPDRPRRPVR